MNHDIEEPVLFGMALNGTRISAGVMFEHIIDYQKRRSVVAVTNRIVRNNLLVSLCAFPFDNGNRKPDRRAVHVQSLMLDNVYSRQFSLLFQMWCNLTTKITIFIDLTLLWLQT